MIETVTVLTVVVGILLGTLVALAGRLSGALQRLDDVAELARVNAEIMEMRARRNEDDQHHRNPRAVLQD